MCDPRAKRGWGELTESHGTQRQCGELQRDEQTRRRVHGVATEMARHQIFEGEQDVHGAIEDEAGDEKVPWAESLDDARKGEELKDAIREPIPSQPQTNRCRTHAEPAKLNRCRPDERDKSPRYHIEQRDHAVIRN